MPFRTDQVSAAVPSQFEILHKIGEGGWASVYLARDQKHGRNVAVKVLRPELASRVGARRFEREIEVVARLRHPHILPLYDSGVSGGTYWYVMPFVEGESLRGRLKREGHLPIREAMRIAREVADALSHTHRHGVVHRDIKPGNILLEGNHAVVTDFGIAALVRELDPEKLTETGASPGTPHYTSPEQASADRGVDHRSDIYSLGCVLYEMLVGEPPFTGPSNQAILARKLAGDVPSLRVVRDTVPEALERITERALERLPGDRFQEASAFGEALSSLRAQVPTPAESVYPRRLTRTQTLLRIGDAVLGTVIGMVVVGWLATKAFDLKLGVPATHRPTRSDHLFVGAQALVNVITFTLAGVGFFLAVDYLLRRAGKLSNWIPALRRRRRRLNRHAFRWWNRLVRSTGPKTLARSFLFVTCVGAVLIIGRFWELLSALWTTETAPLACTERPLHRTFSLTMTTFVASAGALWFAFFRWLGRRFRARGGYALPRWASLAIIVVMLLVLGIPWRLLWDGVERTRLEGERRYLLAETETELVLYDPTQLVSQIHPKNRDAAVERLDVVGHTFESSEVFASGRRKCLAVSLPR